MPSIAGAAGSAAAVAWGAYKYNRMNYIYDIGLRYQRYTAGYSMACEQATMYREDIRDLTAMTVSKQDLYHIVGVIFYVITFQLIMAGRLGVHGPVPPGWLLGIHYTCSCLSMMYLTLSTWLAMHASARATSGAAHMLTRSVRLPIPTPRQLDKARKFGNSFESSRLEDMFRVPFVMPAPKAANSFEAAGSSKTGKQSASSTGGTQFQRRQPKWYSDEADELYAGSKGASPTVPEHFELYRGLQQEWWAHDIYARIALLYFMSSWLHGAAFYIQCHCFGELRAIWPAWSCTFVFVAAQYCILKVDIISEACKHRPYSFPVENIAPLTPLLTVLGMSFEYSIIPPSDGMKVLIYLIAWLCYIIHFLWALRMFDIATPESILVEKQDLPGQPWWPAEWWLPTAFQDALYLMAPPKVVDEDQTCLQQEMRAANGAVKNLPARAPQKKARESMPGLYAYKLFRGATFAMVFMWIFIIFGRIVEQIHGERMLLKQEGRMERWPSHMQPWIAPWTRSGNRDEWAHTGGSDRRLREFQTAANEKQHVAAVAQKLSFVLSAVSEALDAEFVPSRTTAPAVSTPFRQAKVDWPTQLQPTILACGGNGFVAALSHDTPTGATLRVSHAQRTHGLGFEAPASPFSMRGLEGLGRILGASWGGGGLLVATADGALAECIDMPSASKDAAWHCAEVGGRLPTGGSALQRVAAARSPRTGRLRAAVVFEEDETITFFEQAEHNSDEWEPAGDMAAPPAALLSMSMSPDVDELLLMAKDGVVFRWPLDGAARAVAAAPKATVTTSDLTWRSACGLGGGRLAHLAWKKASSMPEFFISSRD
mmetsp:Transcript_72877/g.202154  ORF Transcript_72877/g.202154 Transcript_72877/m.202154 type:complete len:825 (+) Transcript_72877:121-2595(+)